MSQNQSFSKYVASEIVDIMNGMPHEEIPSPGEVWCSIAANLRKTEEYSQCVRYITLCMRRGPNDFGEYACEINLCEDDQDFRNHEVAQGNLETYNFDIDFSLEVLQTLQGNTMLVQTLVKDFQAKGYVVEMYSPHSEGKRLIGNKVSVEDLKITSCITINFKLP